MRAAEATLVGRERELVALREAIVAAERGRGQVVVIEGEAGIGKTRLAREATGAARSQGFDVYEGNCDDIASALPFAPFAHALGISRDSADADRQAIAALLAGDIDDRAEGRLSISGKQFRVTELLGALVEKLAESHPVLLFLDDVHWADNSTLVALRSITPRVGMLPVLIVVTMRPGYAGKELHRTIDALMRVGAMRLAISPLARPEVAALATDLLGEPPSADLLERLEGATGNPLFVREYVDAVMSTPTAEGVPVEFRVAVLRRVGQLSEDTNELVRLAAVLGSMFAASDLAVVVGATPAQLTTRLQQALQSGIIGERGERLAFRHDLVRDAVYEDIPRDLRRQFHREVGEKLAKAGADPRVIAHHLASAAESYDEDAADWLRRAANTMRLRAPSIAVELLEHARDLLPPQSPQHDAVMAELVLPLAWAGRLSDAQSLSLALLDRKPEAGVTGALRCGLVYALTWQGHPQEALAYTVVPDDEILPEPDAVLLRAEAAVAHLLAPDFRAAIAQATQSEAEARASGHDLALCHALTVKSFAANYQGRAKDAVAICEEAISIADRSVNGEGHLAHPRFFPGMALINLDRLDEAEAVLQRGRKISEELGLAWALPLYHSHLGVGRFIRGDWDAAVAELEACLRIADEFGTSSGITVAAASWLAVMQIRRDQIETAEQTVRRTLQRVGGEVKGMGLFHWARAQLAHAKGDVEDALALLESGFGAFLRAGATVTDPWTAVALVRTRLNAGDRAGAATVAERFEQQENADNVASARALASRLRGLVDDDAASLASAIDDYSVSGHRVDLADTSVDLALVLLDSGQTSDAHRHLETAIDIYEDLGAARDLAGLRAKLRARGISRGSRGRRTRPTTGWDSLTETERKVAALVAQRLSNPEVAERLFVSRFTVESHLKNIYRKLGVASRVALANAAVSTMDHAATGGAARS